TPSVGYAALRLTQPDLFVLELEIAERLRLGYVQRALVDRATGDGTDDTGRIGVEQLLDVADVMDAAGGDHRDLAGIGQGHRRLDVAALHHAVLGDVGVDDRRDAIGL